MHGDAAADAHAQGADFRQLTRAAGAIAGPYADGVRVRSRGDAQRVQRVDDDLLELADIPADGQLVIRQTNDGISHELSGPVEGDIAAAVGFDHFDANSLKRIGRGEDVLR